jgi:hypothetical protein
MSKTLALLATVLTLQAAGLAQAPSGPVLSAGVLSPQGAAQVLTQQAFHGLAVQAGYAFHPEGYGAGFMPYVTYLSLPAKSVPGLNTWDLKAPSLGLDVTYQVAKTVTIFTGPNAASWRVSQHGVPDSAQGDTGLKLGWRLGVDYALGRSWSVSAAYTQSQWRSRVDLPYVDGWNPSRPAYFSILANVRF